MIDIVAAATAIGALKNIVDIVDRVGDKWLRYKQTGTLSSASQDHRMQLAVAPDNSQITAQFGGAPRETVTREGLSQRLSAEDLRHLKALETRMNLIAERWDHQATQIELEVNVRTKFMYEQQMKGDEKDLAAVLEQALNFIQSCGFILDDHYQAMRDIAGQVASHT